MIKRRAEAAGTKCGQVRGRFRPGGQAVEIPTFALHKLVDKSFAAKAGGARVAMLNF